MEARQSIVGLDREVPLEAETRSEAKEKISFINIALKQTIDRSGVKDDIAVSEHDGSIKIIYTNHNFRAQLTGILRQGVHGENGPKFSYRVSSEEYIPSLNAADNKANKIGACTVGCSAVFFSAILGVILFFIAGATGFIVLSGWFAVIIGGLSTFLGGAIALIPCMIIWKRAQSKLKTDDHVQTGLKTWNEILRSVETCLDNVSLPT